MTIGAALVASPEATNYVDDIVERAREAAAAGLKSVWFGQRFDYDSPALASIVGREVPELQVGTSAIPLFGRHPLLVNAQAQTAQAVTHGRYHLGLALGAPGFVTGTLGLPYDRPIQLLREFLTVLRTINETGAVDFHGERLTATSRIPLALPGATPAPVLVAAMGPQALRVTGELADGTLPYLAGPRTLGEQIVPAITRAAERAGRPAPRIVAFVAGMVTADVEKVRVTALDTMAFYDQIPSYQRVIAAEGHTRAGELAVIGDETTITKAVQSYFDAGATEVMFSQPNLSTAADRLRTWEILGQLASG